jgi:hypothetical protein
VATARDSRKLKMDMYVGEKRLCILAGRESRDLYFSMVIS